MFPKDTLTYTLHIPTNGAGDYFIYNGSSTVLYAHFLQKNVASDTILKCNGSNLYDNFAQNTGSIFFNIPCNGELKLTKTGNDEAQVIVNYISYIDNATNTTKIITYGDSLIAYLLFILIIGGIFGFITKRFLYKK